MKKYNYEDLEKRILDNIYVDKGDSSVLIALCNENVNIYPLDFNGEGPTIVNNIENAYLHFFNIIMELPNFDFENFRRNMNRNFLIGVSMEQVNSDAGITIFNDNKNLFGIFGDYNLVDRGVIYHELFHFASYPTNFRRGLNEGYTEILTHRYFNKSKLAYPDNVDYVLKLENIIGQDIMENAYSKGDVSILSELFDEENYLLFEKINDRLDLLLGSYYRVNSGKKLADEDRRVMKAKADLDAYLSVLVKKDNYKKR